MSGSLLKENAHVLVEKEACHGYAYGTNHLKIFFISSVVFLTSCVSEQAEPSLSPNPDTADPSTVFESVPSLADLSV